tara:strand:+ start:523 stop:996 length:474 start_codon:yes stop_codon:yes gene_type:complete
MKYFLYIFFNIFSFLSLSAEIEVLGNSRVEYSEFTFSNNSKYIIINQVGQWTDSIGNYGSSICKGLIKKDSDEIIIFLDVICESTDQNNVVTWRQFDRVGSNIQRGVGVSTLIDTTSKHREELIGTKCNYAVNRTKDMVFSKAICKISDDLFRKLTK